MKSPTYNVTYITIIGSAHAHIYAIRSEPITDRGWTDCEIAFMRRFPGMVITKMAPGNGLQHHDAITDPDYLTVSGSVIDYWNFLSFTMW